MCAFMYLYPENLPAGWMPKPQGCTWQQKVYLIAGKSPSHMGMMKVQIFQGTARWVHLSTYHVTETPALINHLDISDFENQVANTGV